MWRRSRLVAGARGVALTVLLCLMLAACIGGANEAAIFAGRDNASALLVRWTEDGDGVLTGSIEVADKAPGLSGVPVKRTTLVFSGRLDAGQVSLKVKGELGQIQIWSGTLDDDGLRVNVPQDANSVETMILPRSSVRTFNADVAALQNAVIKARDEASRSAASVQEETDRREADAAAQRSFQDAVSDVTTSQETVQGLLTTPQELKDLSDELKSARSSLAKVKTAAEEAASRSSGFVACEYATQAENEADDITGDAIFLKDDVQSVNETSGELADAGVDLSRAYLRLQELVESDGESSKFSAATVNSLIGKAKKTSAVWRAEAKTADKQMKSIVSDANRIARKATQAAC